MAQVIRAIYEHGRLRLLDPLILAEGQEVRVAILSEQEQVQMALADILMPAAAASDEDVDEAALMALITKELAGKVSVSDAIIEERREGP